MSQAPARSLSFSTARLYRIVHIALRLAGEGSQVLLSPAGSYRAVWSAPAGGDDLRLSAGPVIHDLLPGNGKRVVWINIVEVSEA